MRIEGRRSKSVFGLSLVERWEPERGRPVVFCGDEI
jgi:hypothetical protein